MSSKNETLRKSSRPSYANIARNGSPPPDRVQLDGHLAIGTVPRHSSPPPDCIQRDGFAVSTEVMDKLDTEVREKLGGMSIGSRNAVGALLMNYKDALTVSLKSSLISNVKSSITQSLTQSLNAWEAGIPVANPASKVSQIN